LFIVLFQLRGQVFARQAVREDGPGEVNAGKIRPEKLRHRPTCRHTLDRRRHLAGAVVAVAITHHSIMIVTVGKTVSLACELNGCRREFFALLSRESALAAGCSGATAETETGCSSGDSTLP
jgi:hypothetical protein